MDYLNTKAPQLDPNDIPKSFTELSRYLNNAMELIDFYLNNYSRIANTTQKQIDSSINTVRVAMSDGLEAAHDSIIAVMNDSYVKYDGHKILVYDNLENPEHVIMIDSAGIGFSSDGGNTFTSAWTIDGKLNMQNISVVGLTADKIQSGTLKLGGANNQDGQLMIFDASGKLIGKLDMDGLKMFGESNYYNPDPEHWEEGRPYVQINNQIGFRAYDENGDEIYSVQQDEFHMKKAVVEEEITIGGLARFIPIDSSPNVGIGIVGVSETAS